MLNFDFYKELAELNRLCRELSGLVGMGSLPHIIDRQHHNELAAQVGDMNRRAGQLQDDIEKGKELLERLKSNLEKQLEKRQRGYDNARRKQ